jgi:hypothetical protein
MSRQITISLVGAAIGVGLLGMSSTSAAPVNGAVIGKAASAEELTEKVVWRGYGVRGYGVRGYGWRGVGWRGGGWRGVGWRPGLAVAGLGLATAGLATAAAYNYGYNNYGYDNYGYGDNYAYGWRPGWGVAAAAQNYNNGYGNYGYGAYANAAYNTSGGDTYIYHGNYISEADAVAYCAKAFRSYDVGSRTFLADSGQRVSCPQ